MLNMTQSLRTVYLRNTYEIYNFDQCSPTGLYKSHYLSLKIHDMSQGNVLSNSTITSLLQCRSLNHPSVQIFNTSLGPLQTEESLTCGGYSTTYIGVH